MTARELNPGIMLTDQQVAALEQAEAWLFESDYVPYLELKTLLGDPSPFARKRFEWLYAAFYGLNQAGLGDALRKHYFGELFSFRPDGNARDARRYVVDSLASVQNSRNRSALHFSFTSKLIAIHDETSPIYDRHVLSFFKVSAPQQYKGREFRIAWFLDFMDRVQEVYQRWTADSRVGETLARLKSRDARLATCHPVRLVDFLVWNVGSKSLLSETA